MGIIGCGQIAQIMHLPYLMELPQYEIGAVCDISPKVVNTVGDWYGVSHRLRRLSGPDRASTILTSWPC